MFFEPPCSLIVSARHFKAQLVFIYLFLMLLTLDLTNFNLFTISVISLFDSPSSKRQLHFSIDKFDEDQDSERIKIK